MWKTPQVVFQNLNIYLVCTRAVTWKISVPYQWAGIGFWLPDSTFREAPENTS